MLNKKALSATAQVEKDSNFNQTVLLLHGDGTNGAQNNTFTDSSTNAFSITRNGNTTQGTFSPFSQTGWSNYFDGTGDYLTAADNSALDLGSGDFTIEGWVYIPTAPSDSQIVTLFSKWGASGQRSWWVYFFNASGTYQIYLTYTTNGTSGGGDLYNEGFSFPAGQWAHIAIVRSTNTVKFYINGSVAGTGSEDISTNTIFDSTTALSIGATASGGNPLTGYMSNFRLVKGTAVYTAAFTPPTAALTNITNTSLLTCQSNRFVDNSSNAFTITRNGDVSVQAFSPFAPTAAYSAATNGGSGYFDGSGDDYLSVANNTALQLGSGDFTVEFWLNFSALSGYQTVFEKGYTNSGGILIQTNNNVGTLLVYASGSAVITASSSSSVGVWDHYALVRSGSTLTLYRNGLSVGSATNSTNFSTTDTLYIGGSTGGGGYYTNGYISNFRIVKGTAVYTAAFTPPTAPLTAITNTSLLCNFTNAGIIDQTAKNVLETVGNAQIDTGTKKFGTGSLEFDGTGDYLVVPAGVNWSFGTGDFTVETWVYLNSVSNNGTIICNSNYAGNSGDWILRIGAAGSASGKWEFTIWGAASTYDQVYSNSAPSTGSWVHLAAVRSSGTMMLFIDGTKQTVTDTSTNAAGFTNQTTVIVGDNSSGVLLNCFLDEFRVTKGVARYTANFTVPSKAFADQ